MKLLDKEYHGFESIIDISQDVEESIAQSKIPGEFQGYIKVTVTYHPAPEDKPCDS